MFMIFKYKVKDQSNQLIKGEVEAQDEAGAAEILKSRGFNILSLTSNDQASIWLSFLKFFRRIPTKDLVVFSRQLAVMVSANMPIVKSLRVLADQTVNRNLQAAIIDIANEVDGGAKLSMALRKHADIFDDFYINLVRSGETTGKLDEVLTYLAEQKERDYELMSRVKGAMIYPFFILSSLIVVGVVMMIFVIPKLTGVLLESGATLPFSTRLLIAVSGFMAKYWWLLLGAVIALAVALRLYIRTAVGREQWDLLKVRVPVFGQIFQRIYLVRFIRGLSTLLRGGVEMVTALKIVADVVDNEFYRQLVLETIREVNEGHSVTTVFMNNPDVPTMFAQMLSVGESSGKIDAVLDNLGDFYSRELDNLTKNLVSSIEPMIIVLMGVAVGIMVAAVILPMYNLSAQF